jgi:hypothetical protein
MLSYTGSSGADDPIRDPTEFERAIRATVLGLVLGAVLALFGQRR